MSETKTGGRLSEHQIRLLRNKVFGQQISDTEWSHCRLNWMQPGSVRWLIQKSKVNLS